MNIRDSVRALKPQIVTASIPVLRKGDPIFVIVERKEIKEAKYLRKTGLNDGSIWAVWAEDWNDDREMMCFYCPAYQWAASKDEANNRLKKILLTQRRELVEQIERIDSRLASLDS